MPACLPACAGEESLVDLETDKLPADSFAMSIEQIWDIIHSQKDLNLPAHKVGLALLSPEA